MRTGMVGLGLVVALVGGCGSCEEPDGADELVDEEHWQLESSAAVVSPSGRYSAVVSSQRFATGEGQSQAVVSHSRGGSGLIAFARERVPMAFEWRGDDELVVRYPNDLEAPRIDATNNSYGFGGRGRVVYEAVPPEELPELTWAGESATRVVERMPLERGELVGFQEGTETRYSYSYYDVSEGDSSAEALIGRGYQGGGESWAGIIHGLLALRAPELGEAVDYNPEGDGLTVESRDRAALLRVAELVAAAKSDGELLDAAIRRAEADGAME